MPKRRGSSLETCWGRGLYCANAPGMAAQAKKNETAKWRGNNLIPNLRLELIRESVSSVAQTTVAVNGAPRAALDNPAIFWGSLLPWQRALCWFRLHVPRRLAA